MIDIRIKRVYELSDPRDGFRVLVDRVWPRGLTKDQVHADLWLKDAAPSTELRKWFNHDHEKWEEFKKRYSFELEAKPETVSFLVNKASKRPLTLLISSRDEEFNQGIALKEYLLLKSKKKRDKT
jgi:uncharacterized protein YeaO (DUF488 family)